MSVEKDSYVSLRQSERDRMMRACNRVDNVERNIQSKVSEMSGKLTRDMQNRMAEMNKRHSNLENHMTDMSEEMRKIEQEQNRKIQQEARNFKKSMESLGNRMTEQRQEYIQMITEQGDRLTSKMNDQRQELQGQINNIQDSLKRKAISEHEQASQWYKDAKVFIDLIDQEYRHEKFAPGTLERIRSELVLCQQNIDQGNCQAAIVSAQQSFLKSSEFRLELERLEMEWEGHLEAAKRNATQVLATCDAQTAARFVFETEDGKEEVAGEIDFWTGGDLSRMKKEVEKALKQLEKSDAMTVIDLKKSIGESEERRVECEKLAERAKEALLASQLRNNIGQTIEKALADANWQITDATYEGEDFRRATHIKLENLQGDEIVTIITPEPDGNNSTRNRVNINFFDRSTNDETFRQSRLKSIMNVLKEDGLECTPPVCAPEIENRPSSNTRKLDFDEVRRSGKNMTT